MPSKTPRWRGIFVKKFCREHHSIIWKETFKCFDNGALSFTELLDSFKYLNDWTRLDHANCSVCNHKKVLPKYKDKIDRHIEAF